MPRATADINFTDKYDLKSCQGGYVVLRRLSYGERMSRQELIGKMRVEAGKGRNKDFAGELDMANKRIIEMEFAKCIVDHNLEDENGTLLNFTNTVDIGRLESRIGEEIGELIDKLHNWDDEGNS